VNSTTPSSRRGHSKNFWPAARVGRFEENLEASGVVKKSESIQKERDMHMLQSHLAHATVYFCSHIMTSECLLANRINIKVFMILYRSRSACRTILFHFNDIHTVHFGAGVTETGSYVYLKSLPGPTMFRFLSFLKQMPGYLKLVHNYLLSALYFAILKTLVTPLNNLGPYSVLK
jgi:hypothetical protein